MSAMYGSIASILRPFVISKGLAKIRIEEWTFRLHFRLTTTILLTCSALLCMKEYLGSNIACAPTHDDESNDPVVPRKIIERYCFIQTTFTVPWNHQASSLQPQSALQGRGRWPHYPDDKFLGGPPYIPDESRQVHHAYYQWVAFFLFFQALSFYAPHVLWKSVENNRIRKLVLGINARDLSVEPTKKKSAIVSVASYILNSKGTNGLWLFTHVTCEFLNLVVILFNIYITDLFLGRAFSTYGPRVLAYIDQDSELRTDPLATVFPKMTKCLFYLFGPSGNVMRFDALCILPMNILNEKIFVFLYFWYLLLGLVSLYAVIRRIATLVSTRLRLSDLQIRVYSRKTEAHTILNRLGVGEWFLLHLLRLNLDHGSFYAIVEEMYQQLR